MRTSNASFHSSLRRGERCPAGGCARFAQEATETITVTAEKLAAARNGIQTQTGASTYTITAKDIQAQPGGDNAQLNSVILQMPGVAQDSFGQLHVRGEHNGLQYRLNGIILPEGISVFGQTLDPRLAESVRLITGALPAEYGNRTAGIIDIQTKSGVFDNGGVVSMYGGSHSTLSPSIAYGGSSGHFNYFVSGDYTTNTLGVESPDGSSDPRHDRTQQYHGFAYLQDILDQNSSVTAVLGTSNAIFQIPNQVGLQPTGLDGIVGLGPQDPGSGDFVLNANGATGFPIGKSRRAPARDHPLRHSQLSAFRRIAGLSRFRHLGAIPACSSRRETMSATFFITALPRPPTSATWPMACRRKVPGMSSRAIPSASACCTRPMTHCRAPARGCCRWMPAGRAIPIPTRCAPIPPRPARPRPRLSPSPTMAASTATIMASMPRMNGQLTANLTVNYGLRYDAFSAFDAENQLSPRVNGVWKPTDTTTIHAGYARYFSPPPFELVASQNVALFDNTTARSRPYRHHAQGRTCRLFRLRHGAKTVRQLDGGTGQLLQDLHNLIDEGQFGAPIILTPFNYAAGPAVWRAKRH